MMRYDTFDGKRHGSTVTTAIRLYRCEYDGKRYDFAVSAKQQSTCPRWDAEKKANPPLWAAKALAKAKEFIATIKTKEGFWWELEELDLVKIDCWMEQPDLVKIDGWMWQARYGLAKQGLMTGPPQEMPCWILMDGTVIQPRITEDKK